MHTVESAIEAIRSGEKEAFGTLYDTFVKRVYDFAFFRTYDEIAAQEIASDTFFKAFRSFGTFGGSSESEFASWLFRIAYNSIVDRARSSKHDESIDDHVDSAASYEDHASEIDAKDKLNKVLAYIDTLPIKQKDIVLMAVWDDLKYAEISEITGESLSNVKKIVSRSLAKISANVALFLLFFLF